MTRDERETLRYLRKPGSIAVLSERLGLSGDTDEVIALCRAIDGLVASGHIELDPSPGWQTYRWRLTSLGIASQDTTA